MEAATALQLTEVEWLRKIVRAALDKESRARF